MADRKSCDLCPKTFASSGSLYTHRQTHSVSGGKRYNCSQCNKSFSQAVHLKRHFLIHTGEKPYKCRKCNYSTNHASHLKITLWNTQERNHIDAINATILQFGQAIWSSTKGPTLGKSLTDAHCVSIPALKLVIWKGTWCGSTQEKCHTSVTNATLFVLLLIICKGTWGRIVGRSFSSATNATKLTRKRRISPNISEFTLRKTDYYHINSEIKNNPFCAMIWVSSMLSHLVFVRVWHFDIKDIIITMMSTMSTVIIKMVINTVMMTVYYQRLQQRWRQCEWQQCE